MILAKSILRCMFEILEMWNNWVLVIALILYVFACIRIYTLTVDSPHFSQSAPGSWGSAWRWVWPNVYFEPPYSFPHSTLHHPSTGTCDCSWLDSEPWRRENSFRKYSGNTIKHFKEESTYISVPAQCPPVFVWADTFLPQGSCSWSRRTNSIWSRCPCFRYSLCRESDRSPEGWCTRSGWNSTPHSPSGERSHTERRRCRSAEVIQAFLSTIQWNWLRRYVLMFLDTCSSSASSEVSGIYGNSVCFTGKTFNQGLFCEESKQPKHSCTGVR